MTLPNPSNYLLTLQHAFTQAKHRPIIPQVPQHREVYLMQLMNAELEYVTQTLFYEYQWHQLLMQSANKGQNYIDITLERKYIFYNNGSSDWVNIIDGTYALGNSGVLYTQTNLGLYVTQYLESKNYKGIVVSVPRIYERTQLKEDQMHKYVVRFFFQTPA